MKLALIAFLWMAPRAFALPDYELAFSRPGFHDGISSTVQDKIVQLLRSAAPGSEVRGSIYELDRPELAQEFLEAKERGVHLKIIADGKNKKQAREPGSAFTILRAGLTEEELKFCSGSCLGIHINHNKFFLFSKLLNGDQNIVVQTSSNLTQSQLHQYVDLIEFKNDSAFYADWLRYWEKLWGNHFQLAKVKTYTGQDLQVFRFPRLLGADPVLRLLNRVSCEIPGSKIRLAQSRFDNSRKAIARRLGELARQGCDVQVIVREETDLHTPGTRVLEELEGHVLVLPYRGSHPLQNTIHAKLTLIDAAVDGSRERVPLVLTGSHNLNITSLKTNDESLVLVRGREVLEPYLAFWQSIADDFAAR